MGPVSGKGVNENMGGDGERRGGRAQGRAPWCILGCGGVFSQLVTLPQERRVPRPGDPHRTNRALHKGPATMTIEYLGLQAPPEKGPFASVSAAEVKQSGIRCKMP